MSNFDFPNLRLVQPFEPAFREARSAVGAEELLYRAELFDSVAAAVGDCSLVVGTSAIRDRELHQPVRLLSEAGHSIRAALANQRVAILFGSEKTGLASEDLDHCNLLLRIPSREEHASLNLAQAVAITLYEIARDNTQIQAPEAAEPKAAAESLERVTMVLLENLAESGYVKGDSADATEHKVRRLIRRMQFDEEDAELWLGMLKKMNWKLKNKQD